MRILKNKNVKKKIQESRYDGPALSPQNKGNRVWTCKDRFACLAYLLLLLLS